MAKHDRYAEFRRLTKEEQRDRILSSAALSIDGAQVSLARWIEIYFDATPEEQEARVTEAHNRWAMRER
jgi:hypothetical protein